MQLDNTLLKQLLFWLIGGGGSGAVVYWLTEQMTLDDPWQPQAKRTLSIVLSILLSWAAYAVATVAFNYLEQPVGWQAWAEALVAVAGFTFTASQVIHGQRQLRSQ